MKTIVKAIAAAALVLSTSSAYASVVQFVGQPAESFAHGTFSVNPNGNLGSFFAVNSTTAFNAYGASGLYISFNTGMNLQQLTLKNYASLSGVQVDIFDNRNSLLGSQSATFNGSNESVLKFNANDVSKVVFNTIGYSGDMGARGWYYVSNINYSANVAAVPEPGALALLCIGLMGVGVSRRRG